MLTLAVFCLVVFILSSIAQLILNSLNGEKGFVIVTGIVFQSLVIYCLITLVMLL